MVKVKEHPIIFSTKTIQAILAGRKTQTRRLGGLKDINGYPDAWRLKRFPVQIDTTLYAEFQHKSGMDGLFKCPYGQVGGRLWVKETWCESYYGKPICYKADGGESPGPKGFWRSSLFMSHKNARITLEITGVRVERLQEITEQDAYAEGCPSVLATMATVPMVNWYEHLWDSLNAKNSWETNPWVWVIEFKKING